MQTALAKIVPSNAFWDQSSMFLKSLMLLQSFALSLVRVVSSGRLISSSLKTGQRECWVQEASRRTGRASSGG